MYKFKKKILFSPPMPGSTRNRRICTTVRTGPTLDVRLDTSRYIRRTRHNLCWDSQIIFLPFCTKLHNARIFYLHATVRTGPTLDVRLDTSRYICRTRHNLCWGAIIINLASCSKVHNARIFYLHATARKGKF